MSEAAGETSGPTASRGRLAAFEDALSVGALVLMAAIPIVEAVIRPVYPTGIPGSSLWVQHLTLWVGFLGGAVAARRSELLSLSAGPSMVSDVWKPRLLSRRKREGVAALVGFAPVAARRAVSFWVLGGGVEGGVDRTAHAGVGAAPAGIAASFVVEAARRCTAACDSGVGVAWWPASGSVFGAAAVCAGRAACFAAGTLRPCACSGVGVGGAFAFASAGPRARAAPGAAPAPAGSRRRSSPSARSGRRRAGARGRPAAPAPGPGRPASGGPAVRSCRPPRRRVAVVPPHPAPAAAPARRRTVRPARSLPPDRSVPLTPPPASPPTPPVRSPRCRRSTRGAAAGRTPTAAPRRRSASASRRATPPARAVDRRTAAWRLCAERRQRRCSRARVPRSRTGWRSLAPDAGRAPRSRSGGR